ncbi:BTB/POZ domain-containing protein KCTD9 [Hondaea fermentalgiana]|uniref:BTB/POZ domain-containing protein KCTD9 n=1 Tax=Hondaea fermentalgiana TaxID=2315210 RepID=A0A2R5GMK4_9STRA|nr:BTB/POZ domain-containing protein KCTD9 [Hondaea fermentalgiana]|eukprot:GBG32110.1 BTB/POZ domain-containing protein KCTD9 [Hondaea fermentalgiana]
MHNAHTEEKDDPRVEEDRDVVVVEGAAGNNSGQTGMESSNDANSVAAAAAAAAAANNSFLARDRENVTSERNNNNSNNNYNFNNNNRNDINNERRNRHGSAMSVSSSVMSAPETDALREVPINILSEVDALRKERSLLAKERSRLEELRMEGGKLDNKRQVINLNVGGKSFVTTSNTLAACNGSLLYSIVKHSATMKAWTLEDASDAIFIDRDGEHFGYIVNWLRAKACCSGYKPPPLRIRDEVIIEAEYFGIDDLADFLRSCRSSDCERIEPLRLLELKSMGATDFDGANFSNGSFDGVTFSSKTSKRHARCAKFTSSSLQRARFDVMNLEHADFSGSRLDGASFRGANLSGAVFDGASLRKVDFSGACLEGAMLERAETLNDCVFAGAKMHGILLRDRLDLQRVCMERADLSEADLSGSNLQRANLKGAQLHHAHLQGCCLRYSSLQPSDCQRLNHGSQEQETDLQNADLSGCDFLCATLQRVNFQSAKLDGVIFSGANTRGARFEDTHLESIRGSSALPGHHGPGAAHGHGSILPTGRRLSAG